jgi:glycosyltransferase involved in cell wall biosynthesis
MPRFSLIIATLGRTADLALLLESVYRQQTEDIEIVVADQNDDDRVSRLLHQAPTDARIVHLRLTERNVSAARNAGMDAATGEILAFPDDDCWYPDGLLQQVDAWFRSTPEYAVLAVGAIDDRGLPSGNRWLQSACDIRPINALRTTFCSSLFIAAPARSRAVRFDPTVSRGEETDFILRLLANGLRGRFDRSLHIHHPRRDMLSGTVTRARALSYGAGMGRLVRRHSLLLLWTALLAYDIARALLVSCRGRFADAVFCFAHAEGLLRGFLLPGATYE